MELFTLGVGHYNEADVQEAARGAHRLERGRESVFRFDLDTHDDQRIDDPRPPRKADGR